MVGLEMVLYSIASSSSSSTLTGGDGMDDSSSPSRGIRESSWSCHRDTSINSRAEGVEAAEEVGVPVLQVNRVRARSQRRQEPDV